MWVVTALLCFFYQAQIAWWLSKHFFQRHKNIKVSNQLRRGTVRFSLWVLEQKEIWYTQWALWRNMTNSCCVAFNNSKTIQKVFLLGVIFVDIYFLFTDFLIKLQAFFTLCDIIIALIPFFSVLTVGFAWTFNYEY